MRRVVEATRPVHHSIVHPGNLARDPTPWIPEGLLPGFITAGTASRQILHLHYSA